MSSHDNWRPTKRRRLRLAEGDGVKMGCVVATPVAEHPAGAGGVEDETEHHLNTVTEKIDTLADALMARATPGRVQDYYEVYNTSLGEITF